MTWCWLLEVSGGSRRRLLGGILLGALASGCAIALMACSAWLIARASQHPPVLYLQVAIVGVRAFGLGRGVFRYAERLVSHDAALRVLARIRESLMTKLAELAPAGLPLWRRADLLSRMISDVDDAGDAFLRGLLPLAVAAVAGTGTIVLLALILPVAGLALALCLLTACVVVPWLSSRRTARVQAEVVTLRGERNRLVGDMWDELSEIAVLGRLPANLDQLQELEAKARKASASSARTAGVAAGVAVLSMGAAVWLSAWFGTAAVAHAGINPVLLAVIVVTPLALTDTVQAVGFAARALQRSSAATRRITEVLDTPPPTAPAPADAPPLPAVPHVVLKNVSARWPGQNTDAISNVNLELCPGRRILLSGPSGSGKSTLIAVLLGFLPLSSGTITIDGVDVGELDPEETRTLFSWCEQQAYLFDSSLAENIRLARPAATDPEVAAALSGAGASEWLESLPRGLDTRMGEHGQAISGGQRQRVSLARALLADRPVLLADEPAAHLDGPTADAITRAVMTPDPRRATLLVSHRERDAELADVVLRMESGRLIE